MDTIKEILHYLDPQYLLGEVIPTEWVVIALVFIIFAETGLLFGFFLPGDSLLFTAGLFVNSGEIAINVFLLMTYLIGAAIIGDQVGYFIGRRIGVGLYKLKDTWYFKQKYVEQTQAFYDKYGGVTIIIGRFVPIVRTFAPTLAGVARLPYSRFVPYNIVGGLLWIPTMLLAGYYLAEFDIVRNNVGKVAILIILLSVLPIAVTALRERRRQRRKP